MCNQSRTTRRCVGHACTAMQSWAFIVCLAAVGGGWCISPVFGVYLVHVSRPLGQVLPVLGCGAASPLSGSVTCVPLCFSSTPSPATPATPLASDKKSATGKGRGRKGSLAARSEWAKRALSVTVDYNRLVGRLHDDNVFVATCKLRFAPTVEATLSCVVYAALRVCCCSVALLLCGDCGLHGACMCAHDSVVDSASGAGTVCVRCCRSPPSCSAP